MDTTYAGGTPAAVESKALDEFLSPAACQYQCLADTYCQFFVWYSLTYVEEAMRLKCFLHFAGASPSLNYGTVGGPKLCLSDN